jgi:PadR family transcriptional regulator, regulatory protein AphA
MTDETGMNDTIDYDYDLSHQEYLVLGLIGMGPQSGYGIISYFEDNVYRWSASPGSVYPMLKRLEKQKIILGDLEMVYEARPRKMYTLTALGDQVLDDWLHQPPDMPPLHMNREMSLLQFLFMENRLPLEDIIYWLKNYQDSLDMYDYGRRLFTGLSLEVMEEYELPRLHHQLVMEETLMEINTLRTWLQMTQARLETEAARRAAESPTEPPAEEAE